MTDERLLCATCGREFVFTDAERSFFAERSLAPPKRCKACRQARKQQRSTSGIRPAFPPEHPSGTMRSPVADARPSYPIRCVDCGANAKVPFKPVEGRPVYCPTCYRARKGSARQATDGIAIDDDDSGIIE